MHCRWDSSMGGGSRTYAGTAFWWGVHAGTPPAPLYPPLSKKMWRRVVDSSVYRTTWARDGPRTNRVLGEITIYCRISPELLR